MRAGLRISCLVMGWLWFCASTVHAEIESKIGVLAKRGPERCLQMYQPTAKYLTAKIPGYSFTIVPLGFEEIFPAVATNRVDFILNNSSQYAELEKMYGVSRLVTMKNRRPGGGFVEFGGVILCRSDRSDLIELSQLKGKRFMAVNETSFGGWRMAWRELKDQGVNPHKDFEALLFGGTHDAVVYAVRDGTVDAGTVRTDTLERMAHEGAIELDDYHILNRQENETFPFEHSTRLYPEWPLARLVHTSEELSKHVAVAMLEMPYDGPAAKASLCEGWTVPRNYQPVHDCLRELRIGPYKDYGQVSLLDATLQHWNYAAIIVALLGVLVLATFYATRLNFKLQYSSTELQEANERLESAKNTADAANQAKSAFLANMSHELRTPMNAILGFTQLMQRDKAFPETLREDLDIINRSGHHLLGLINDVLDIAKIEAGRAVLAPSVFNLSVFTKSIGEMFLNRTQTKNLQFHQHEDPALPENIKADEGKLRQILINLLGNAVKFTKTGKISFHVGVVAEEEPKTRQNKPDHSSSERVTLRFQVEDTGIGIQATRLDKIFEPFVQASLKEHENVGTGLGLAISRQYVELMSGRIEAQSELGQGSTFSFEIPVERAESNDLETTQEPSQIVTLAPDQPTRRILVVEDQPENRLLLTQLLKMVGFEVYEAVNGAEGVEMFLAHEPDLVWMDMRMPVMDGIEATRRIKGTPLGSSTPVIALTAHAFEEEREEFLESGCNDFVRKPFRESEIFEKMALHLGVEYIEQEADPEPRKAAFSDLMETGIAGLKPELIQALHQAAVRGSLVDLEQLVDQIEPDNPGLAQVISNMAESFSIEPIIKATELCFSLDPCTADSCGVSVGSQDAAHVGST